MTVVGERPPALEFGETLTHSWGDSGYDNGARNGPDGPTDSDRTDSREEEEKECVAKSAVKYATCNAFQSAIYADTLSQSCAGRGTITGGGNAVFVEGSASYDAYTQCKDIAQADRNNALDVCTVFQANRIASCL
ncbi:hypothetical protein JK628_16360 [Shewanella sp. KX20019]|uniref:hypothetical protein n=1 Tax=Shewanella sp. KX20019 TaxID=2803864 RepID=UPI0019253F87|nr:hypothetical protein [Shewanella sp. KX20019]QQX79119.1 hypothetical protein JK628_16360 [Shewanella sp. KX20019]